MAEQLELIRIMVPRFIVQGWLTAKPLAVDNIKYFIVKKALGEPLRQDIE